MVNHLSYFRSKFWGSETRSYLFWVSTSVTSCGQPEGIDRMLSSWHFPGWLELLWGELCRASRCLLFSVPVFWRSSSLGQAPGSILLLLGLFSGDCLWLYLCFFSRHTSCSGQEQGPNVALKEVLTLANVNQVKQWWCWHGRGKARNGGGVGGGIQVHLWPSERKSTFQISKKVLHMPENSCTNCHHVSLRKKYPPFSVVFVWCPAFGSWLSVATGSSLYCILPFPC